MMTVNEVSKLTGVSIRTLQYYDKIGLLSPANYTQAGYRLYNDSSLETLQQILLFRELEFPLKEIKQIISSPHFDRTKAIEQQITLLTLKKEHLENLIRFAQGLENLKGDKMNFDAFDTTKIDEYIIRARKQWGHTEAFKEFESKEGNLTTIKHQQFAAELMTIFAEIGGEKVTSPSSEHVQTMVKKLQDYISDNFYKCTNEILLSLGQMYVASDEFRSNIDAAGGKGTAEFVLKAIEFYYKKASNTK